MPKHDFGIMQIPPQRGAHYNRYEPEKYHCISVDDDYLEPLLGKLKVMKCYWHTVNRPEFGLAYTGITLIPPESLDIFIEIIWNNPKLSELMALLKEAEENGKYVIHFGI